MMARTPVRRRRRAWWILPALCGLVLLGTSVAGCGGDKKKPSKSGKGTSGKGKGKGETAGKGKGKSETPVKPKKERSRSGKTAIELVNLLGDSYKTLDATMTPDDLAKAEDERVRWVGELVDMGEGALGDVLDALKHPVAEVREWACVVLGAAGKSEAAEALLALALDDRDRNLGIHACDALGRLEGVAGAMQRLAPRLATQPFQAGHPLSEAQAGCLRNAAAEAVTRGGSKDGIPVLIANLAVKSAEVRRDAGVRLRRLTGQDHPVAVDASPDDRKAAIVKWEQWWEQAKGLYKPKPEDSASVHQVFAGAK